MILKKYESGWIQNFKLLVIIWQTVCIEHVFFADNFDSCKVNSHRSRCSAQAIRLYMLSSICCEDQKADLVLRELPRKLKLPAVELLRRRHRWPWPWHRVLSPTHFFQTLDAQLLACTDYSGCPARDKLVSSTFL